MRLMEHLAMEAAASTVAKETEVAIYAHMTNIQGLEQANSKEEHIQLDSEFVTGQRCRCRKTTKPDGSTKIQMTMKVKGEVVAGIDSSTEYTVDISEEFFEAFKPAAKKMLMKTRYNFVSKDVKMTIAGSDTEIILPNVIYEVDVFKNQQGGQCEWVKIDVEVDSIMDFMAKNYPDITTGSLTLKVSHLPFQPTDAIIGSTQDPQKKEFLGQLWDTQFNLKPV